MEQKNKASGKELVMILVVVVLAFGLTVGGIIYLTGFILDDKTETQQTRQVQDTVNRYVIDDNTGGETDNTGDKVAIDNQTVTGEKLPADSNAVVSTPVDGKKSDIITKPQVQKQPQQNQATQGKPEQKPVAESQKPQTLPAKPKPATDSSKTGLYEVQLSSFQTVAAAESEALRFIKKYPDIYILKVDLESKGIWYRVRCCRVDSREKAEEIKEDIERNSKIIPMIIHVK